MSSPASIPRAVLSSGRRDRRATGALFRLMTLICLHSLINLPSTAAMFLDTLAATQLLWSLSALAFTTKLPLGLALAVLALAVFAEAARRAARR